MDPCSHPHGLQPSVLDALGAPSWFALEHRGFTNSLSLPVQSPELLLYPGESELNPEVPPWNAVLVLMECEPRAVSKPSQPQPPPLPSSQLSSMALEICRWGIWGRQGPDGP